MNDEDKTFWGEALMFLIGIIVGALISLSISGMTWKKDAIDHGVAYYNPTNANFQWVTLTNKLEKN